MTPEQDAILDLNAADTELAYQIKKFHVHFGIGYIGKPRLELPTGIETFRCNLMEEELQEYKDAETIEDKYDALIDMLFVLLGTFDLHGLPVMRGFNEVMRANLEKQVGVNTNRDFTSIHVDLVKPEGWTAPNLTKVLNTYLEDIKLCQS